MKSKLQAVAFASVLVSAPAFAQSPPPSDQDFVAKVSVGNTFEVEEAKLALDRATDTRAEGLRPEDDRRPSATP